MRMDRRNFLIGSTLPLLMGAANKPKIKIAQIGTGHAHASGKMQAVRKYPEIFNVAGIAEPDPKRSKALNDPAYLGLTTLTEAAILADESIQVVVVETEVKKLVPTALKCIKAGKHIHLDKPAGESLESAKKLHQEADNRKLTVQMGYMLRYNPSFEFLFQAVKDGWLGEITEVIGMMGKKASDGLRKELSQYKGGGMFELACHLIDATVTILGKPLKVAAYNHRTDPDKDTFIDNQLAVLDYKKAVATIRCNHVDPAGFKRRMFSVTGTQGTILIQPLEGGKVLLTLDRPQGKYKKGTQEISLPRSPGRYDKEFIDLAAIVRGEKKLAWNSKHDIDVHEAVLKASGVIE